MTKVKDKEYEVYVTTVDNPFDPKFDSENWNSFDRDYGYNSNSRAARLLRSSPSDTEKEALEAWELAIDRLIEIDPLHIFVKKIYEV